MLILYDFEWWRKVRSLVRMLLCDLIEDKRGIPDSWGQIIEDSPTRTNQSFVMVSDPSQVRPSYPGPGPTNGNYSAILKFIFSDSDIAWEDMEVCGVSVASRRGTSECQRLINKYGSCYQTLFSVVTPTSTQGRFLHFTFYNIVVSRAE